MSFVSCVFLAAGLSRRMGAENKLLLPLRGKSLVKKSLENVVQASFNEVVAVTGYESEKVEMELQNNSIRIVNNENFETGLHSSIRRGVQSLNPKSEGFAVFLADQPEISPAVLEKMIHSFSKTQGPRILFPSSQGQKGNPVFISKHFVDEILNEPDGDYGCFYLFKRHPKLLIEVDVDDASILKDIDTPEDYRHEL